MQAFYFCWDRRNKSQHGTAQKAWTRSNVNGHLADCKTVEACKYQNLSGGGACWTHSSTAMLLCSAKTQQPRHNTLQ